MTRVKTRIRISPDGTLSGYAAELPAGEHEAEIRLLEGEPTHAAGDADALLARVRAIQSEIAQLRVRDARSAEEIIGYNERGSFE